VASAQVASCDLLLTEDLQDGMDLDGVRVADPFRLAPTDPR
jgi:predicted nucleic acid-binding protein